MRIAAAVSSSSSSRLSLSSLFLISLHVGSVLGQQHVHERRLVKANDAAVAAAVLTQTVTSFVTVTASASSVASTSSTSTSSTQAVVDSSTTFPQDGTSLNVNLIPPYGVQQNISLNDGTANCAGLGGKAIPCDCPPDPSKFVSSLNTFVTSGKQQFPEGTSVTDQLTRLESCIVALQNVFGGPGSGVGCPAVSTNWTELQTTLQAEARFRLS